MRHGVPARAEVHIVPMAEVYRRLKEEGNDVGAFSPEQEGRIVVRSCTPTADGNTPFETLSLALADRRWSE